MQTVKIVISWSFLLYFVILFAERTQSIVSTVLSGRGLFSSGFDSYVNLLTILSLTATVILLIGFNGGFLRSLFSGDATVNTNMLCITAGALLLSGMVHTEHTIPGIQFAAYGVLIVGLVLRTVITARNGAPAFELWYSLIYLVVFSMAIPVMYHSSIEHAALFHVLEAITAFVLVVMFTFMMMRVMNGESVSLLMWVPFIVMLIPDAVLIAMRWKEQINWFVLIFAALSAFLFIVGKIIFVRIR